MPLVFNTSLSGFPVNTESHILLEVSYSTVQYSSLKIFDITHHLNFILKYLSSLFLMHHSLLLSHIITYVSFVIYFYA
jgi:hypothetical protein